MCECGHSAALHEGDDCTRCECSYYEEEDFIDDGLDWFD